MTLPLRSCESLGKLPTLPETAPSSEAGEPVPLVLFFKVKNIILLLCQALAGDSHFPCC